MKEDGKTVTMERICFEPFKPLNQMMYSCDKKFYVNELKGSGFIEPKPDNPLYIPPWKLRRMGNSDEKHHKLSNEGAASGPCANVLINPTSTRCSPAAAIG